jgi:hypothetical protein
VNKGNKKDRDVAACSRVASRAGRPPAHTQDTPAWYAAIRAKVEANVTLESRRRSTGGCWRRWAGS